MTANTMTAWPRSRYQRPPEAPIREGGSMNPIVQATISRVVADLGHGCPSCDGRIEVVTSGRHTRCASHVPGARRSADPMSSVCVYSR
jgi:hypothetical protein